MFTPVEKIDRIHATARQAFKEGKVKPIGYRKRQLAQLAYLIQDNIERFQAALKADLGKPTLESNFMEISQALIEAVTAYKQVDSWAKPQRAPFNINTFAMGPKLIKDPRGVVLIISPFNYPLSLSLGPLAGAIAAGNAAVIKPSELSPAVASLIAELVPMYLDPELYHVVLGAVPESTKLLELRWDHILYTGGSNVARIVATAAAKHLTPITLELGGKSPVIVDDSADLKLAAKRILWGKASNAGQTCIAPDYILISRHKQEDLLSEFTEIYHQFYPDGPAQSDSIGRIVSDNHFIRVKTLLDQTRGRIVLGGQTNAATKFIAPTIIANVPHNDILMQSEIFGPLLPIVPVDNLDRAIEFINQREHPLALYVFARDSKVKTKVINSTQSGALSFNEVMVHGGVDGFPTGGVGGSGYGAHRGKFSFDTFTQIRPIMDCPSWVDLVIGSRFPPYTDKKRKILDKVNMHKVPFARPGPYWKEGYSKWYLFWLLSVVGGLFMLLRKNGFQLQW